MKILVIDDDELSLHIIQMMLSSQNLSLVIASSASEALKEISKGIFDLVFLDLHMPGTNGMETCRQIREMEDSSHHLPIIALTAAAIQGEVQNSLYLCMDDYVSKPFKIKDLLQIIDNCSRGLYNTKINRLSLIGSQQTDPNEILIGDLQVLEIQGSLPYFGNDARKYYDILDEFISSLPGRLDRMRSTFSAGKYMDLSTQAHDLKGLSGYLGAMQLSTAAWQLDYQCRNNQLDLAAGTILKIQDCINSLQFKYLEIMGKSGN